MNSTKNFQNLKIALLGSNFAWEMLLSQEGFFYDILSDEKEIFRYTALVISSKSVISYQTMIKFVREGGLILSEAEAYLSLSGEKGYYKEIKFLISDEESYFANIGLIDIYGKITYLSNFQFIDKKLKISYRKIGKGHLLLIPFNLHNIFSNHEFGRKKFYIPNHELPSEDVSMVSKCKFAELITMSLSYLFDKKRVPLISKWYYPKGFKHFFNFRIDTDFCKMQDAQSLLNVINKYEISSTWFIDTANEDNIKNFYSNLNLPHEVGFHAYRHLVFERYKENYENISKGLSILKKYRIKPAGFAAPFGEWNITLQRVIDDFGFEYSSEFGFDYDNFPSFPRYAGRNSSALQIPVHPISIGRLIRSHFSSYDMIKYYKYVVDNLKLTNIPIIIYHHPHHKYFDVIDALFNMIKNDETMMIGTMQELANWWNIRENIKSDVMLDGEKIIISNPKGYIRVIKDGKFAIIKAKESIENLTYKELYKNKIDKNIAKIRKPHWRDVLYNYEKKKSKRRL